MPIRRQIDTSRFRPQFLVLVRKIICRKKTAGEEVSRYMCRGFGLSLLLLASLLTFSCGGGGGYSETGNERLLDLSTPCGTLGLEAKVINGEACSEESSPVVAIVVDSGGEGVLCSGSFVSTSAIVTAAHCFNLPRVTGVRVFQGQKEFRVKSYAVNPLYEYLERDQVKSSAFDTAVVKIEGSSAVTPLPVLLSDRDCLGSQVAVYGYGEDETGGLGQLHGAHMIVEDLWFGGFAAKYDTLRTNICHGDSGGPVIAVREGTPVIMGTVSFSFRGGCLDGDVAHFPFLNSRGNFNFIKQHVPDVAVF